MIEVVAGLIFRQGRFLIGKRPAKKPNGGLWEFVGGKVDPGETKEEALIREAREELDVTVTVGKAFMEVTHTYPDITIHLTLFEAAIPTGEPRCLAHEALRWITPGEIGDYVFCPADRAILDRIRTVYLSGEVGV